MTHFRQTPTFAAIIAVASVALVAGARAADAQTTVIVSEPVQTGTVVTTAPVQLTPVQRQTVYRTIVHERVQAVQPTIEYRVGTRVAPTTQLYAVPESVAVEVPTVQSYRYMLVNNRVMLVDPVTSEVVAELAD